MSNFNGLRVLLVEDEFLIAAALQEELEGLGCRVVGPFASLDQALSAIEREVVDAAVLDVNIGGEMVFPLTERLRAKRVPVVFCTAYAASGLIPENLQSLPCLAKPCSGPRLRTILVQALAVPSAQP